MEFDLHRQHTIAREVSCSGIGLHSGARVLMKLKPAPPGRGIRFRRMDVCNQPVVSARYHEVVSTAHATSIGFDGVVISTIEHLMAAFLGTGVDNVLVEVNGPEVPIYDGSAAPYVELLQQAGLKEQNAPRQCFKVQRPFQLEEGDAYVRGVPSDRFRVRYEIDFPHPLVGRQEFCWTFDQVTFAREIARARTFGFLKDVQRLQEMGLARGGSLANAVVFDDRKLLNEEGFRYRNECVRHKILDFVGDLALAGVPLLGYFEVHKAGHALHSRFLKQIMAAPGLCAPAIAAPTRKTFFPAATFPNFPRLCPQPPKPF